jgi:integrase
MSSLNIFDKLHRVALQPSQLAIAIEILKTYNCRANEVLKASWTDFYKDSMLILPGSKKSANVIIRDRFILSLIDRLPRLDDKKIFPSLNYYHLYHHCKIYYSHLFVKFKKRHNYKVTHGFRYRAVELVANEEKIRDILHHRSIKSGKFYKLK